jgi:hypothetical protein
MHLDSKILLKCSLQTIAAVVPYFVKWEGPYKIGTIVPQKEATFNGRDLIRWVLLYLKKRQSLILG